MKLGEEKGNREYNEGEFRENEGNSREIRRIRRSMRERVILKIQYSFQV